MTRNKLRSSTLRHRACTALIRALSSCVPIHRPCMKGGYTTHCMVTNTASTDSLHAARLKKQQDSWQQRQHSTSNQLGYMCQIDNTVSQMMPHTKPSRRRKDLIKISHICDHMDLTRIAKYDYNPPPMSESSSADCSRALASADARCALCRCTHTAVNCLCVCVCLTPVVLSAQ